MNLYCALTKPREEMVGDNAWWDFRWEIMTEKLTLFVPNAMDRPMPATPPWQTLGLLRLSWWKGEVEEMIERLRGGGLGDALWSGRV
jgi:hypothetical protein